jgi:DNA repair protein RecO (recombination protein O)
LTGCTPPGVAGLPAGGPGRDEIMPVHCADSLVLRTFAYGEADRIVVFLTADRGKKRGVAKNASRSRRRFGAALEPLTRGRATYVEREGRDLVRLDRVEPSGTPLQGVAALSVEEGARRLGYALYFAELIDEWAPNDAPNERLYRLGAAAARALESAEGSIEVLARYVEVWVLRLEGVYPSIDRCARCASRLTGPVRLSRVDRGYVCRECRSDGPIVSREALELLRVLPGRTPEEAVRIDAPAAVVREVEMAHRILMAEHLDKPLRSSRVIKELGSSS